MIKQYQATLKTHGGTSKMGRLGGKCLSKTSNLWPTFYMFPFRSSRCLSDKHGFPIYLQQPRLKTRGKKSFS
jgi:hypothetical protein